MDSQVQSAIASYQEAQIAFHEATAKTQESLEACGWKWVARIISEYGEDHRYEHLLVSPRMYGFLKFEPIEWSDIDDGRPVWDDVLDAAWTENVDYILF